MTFWDTVYRHVTHRVGHRHGTDTLHIGWDTDMVLHIGWDTDIVIQTRYT